MAERLTPVPGGEGSDEDLALLEDELGRLARELTSADFRLDTPPVGLWSLIDAEVQGGVDPGDNEFPRSEAPPVPRGPRLRTSRLGIPRGLASISTDSPLVHPGSRRGRTGLYGLPAVLGAAAALALILAAGAALIVRTTNATEVVAQAAIANDGLPVSVDGSGLAVLKQRGDDRYLELELPELGAVDPNSIYEVWMIDTDVSGMISLGNLSSLDGRTARIDLPTSIDHSAFPVVDISVEPLDGDPTHSGQSVLRGVLTDVVDA